MDLLSRNSTGSLWHDDNTEILISANSKKKKKKKNEKKEKKPWKFFPTGPKKRTQITGICIMGHSPKDRLDTKANHFPLCWVALFYSSKITSDGCFDSGGAVYKVYNNVASLAQMECVCQLSTKWAFLNDGAKWIGSWEIFTAHGDIHIRCMRG